MLEVPVANATLFPNSITELQQAESALELAWEELEAQTIEIIDQLGQISSVNSQTIGERFATVKQLRQQLKTRKKQATTQEELRRQEQAFSTLAENSTDIIARFDRQLCYLYVNQAVEPATGKLRGEFIGKTNQELGLPTDFCDLCDRAFPKVFRTGKQEIIELEFPTPDGIKYYHCRIIPEFAEDNGVETVLVIAHYITEFKEIEWQLRRTELKELNENLEAANQELESFYYSVSHDFRAPLRHISGFINILKNRLEATLLLDDDKIAHYIQVIDDSSQKMSLLIDGLLALSRVGSAELIQMPIELTELVKAAIELAQPRAMLNLNQTSETVEFKIGNLPSITGDSSLLQQVFSNLIGNAVKFSRGRNPAIIVIDSLPDGTIFVKDNGVGFDMEYANQLFRAFGRLHSQKEFEGTGIGLAIAWRIIHRHGGQIWAESAPDRGATFYFKLS